MNINKGLMGAVTREQVQLPVKVKYCLYARKSSESEKRQALSIDSQIKEMTQLAEKEKLENDNRGVNVMRGLRARVETGLWPGMAPLGYLNQKLLDKRCELIVDKKRVTTVRLIQKAAMRGRRED